MKKTLRRVIAIFATAAVAASTMVVTTSANGTGLTAYKCATDRQIKVVNDVALDGSINFVWVLNSQIPGTFTPHAELGDNSGGTAQSMYNPANNEGLFAGALSTGFPAGELMWWRNFNDSQAAQFDALTSMSIGGVNILVPCTLSCCDEEPEPTSEEDTSAEDTSAEDTSAEDTTQGGGDTTAPVQTGAGDPTVTPASSSAAPGASNTDGNPGTGVAIAIIPAIVAAGAAVVASKKRK